MPQNHENTKTLKIFFEALPDELESTSIKSLKINQ